MNQTLFLQTTCQTVPVCNKVLKDFPPPSPFSTGLENFSLQYQQLNSSFNSYQALYSRINQSDIAANLQQMDAAAAQIYSLSHKIPLNPLFPAPVNMTPQQVTSICANYGANNGPWYCYAVGFCEYTNSNYTSLQSAQGR